MTAGAAGGWPVRERRVAAGGHQLAVAAGGHQLAVAEAGEGPDRLLIVHGFCGGKEDFTEWLPALAGAGWHAAVFDLLGHGASDRPADPDAYSLEAYAASVLEVAGALGWDRFVLLGYSMGGMVAQLVALDAGRRLRGLILMDTGHGPVDHIDPGLLELGMAVVRQDGLARLHQLQQELGAPLATPAHERLLAERPGYREFCDAKSVGASPDMWLAMVPRMVGQASRLPALAGLDLPVLVVVGSEDEGFFTQAAELAEAIPGARLEVLAGGGHAPQFEAPEAWWAAVSTFLDGIRAGGGAP